MSEDVLNLAKCFLEVLKGLRVCLGVDYLIFEGGGGRIAFWKNFFLTGQCFSLTVKALQEIFFFKSSTQPPPLLNSQMVRPLEEIFVSQGQGLKIVVCRRGSFIFRVLLMLKLLLHDRT